MFIYQKFLFIFILMMGTMLTISSNNWFSTWLGLEINLIAFIPLINKQTNFLSSESSLIYFLFQVFASLIFLFSILIYLFKFWMNFYMIYSYLNFLFLISLLMKIGSAPFHFWIPMVMENLNWMNNFILMFWQKIAPMILILYSMKIKLLFYFIIMSSFISAIKGFNQTSLRKIMAFSSINQISWMLSSLMINEMIWKIYFIFYFFLLMNLILILMKFNLFYLSNLFFFNFKYKYIKLFLFFNMLSMGGLPPFLGFFPKMMVIQNLINNNIYIIIFMMIIFTLIILYYYMRLMYNSFLINSLKFKSLIMNKNFNMKMIIFMNFINNFFLMFYFLFYFY